MNIQPVHSPDRHPRHVPDRHLEDSVRELDLVAQARDASRDAVDGHFALTLAKQGGLRVVLLALRRGAQMPRHHAASAISVQVLFGRLGFGVLGSERELGPGRMLVVAPDLPHDLFAYDDTILLLTLGGT